MNTKHKPLRSPKGSSSSSRSKDIEAAIRSPPSSPSPASSSSSSSSSSTKKNTSSSSTNTSTSSKSSRNVNDVKITVNSSKRSNKKYDSSSSSSSSVLKYGVLAHKMSLGTSLLMIMLGVYSLYWSKYSNVYQCTLANGTSINSNYIGSYNDNNGDALVCSTVYNNHYLCCDPYTSSHIIAMTNSRIGILYIIYGIIIILIIENTSMYGLWHPKGSYSYQYKVSPTAVVHFTIGMAGLFDVATVLAGSCLIITSIVYQYTALVGEYNDNNGSNSDKNDSITLKILPSEYTYESCCSLISNNCYSIYRLIKRTCTSYASSSSSSSSPSYYGSCYKYLNIYHHVQYIYYNGFVVFTIWVAIILVSNAILFTYTLYDWRRTIQVQTNGLIDGTLDIYCSTNLCSLNRKIIRYGPLSVFFPWAKAFGACLNMNCALVFFTVVPSICENLIHLQQVLISMTRSDSSIIMRMLSVPLSNVIPIKKMFAFHYIYVAIIFVFSWGHVICHYTNIISSNEATMVYVRKWGWDGTCFFTGSIIIISMLIIYAGSSSLLELTHYFIWIFVVMLMLHSQYYFIWALFPITLYLFDIFIKRNRMTKPAVVTDVDVIASFLVMKLRPAVKSDFVFTDGSYVYINCPLVSTTDWFPFPISSTMHDLQCSSNKRIELVTGESVIPAPRPLSIPSDSKWSKYIKEHQDLSALHGIDPNSPIFIEKYETGYDEFISLHINTDVHVSNAKEAAWLSKLKEYLETIDGSKNSDKFPRHYYSLDDHNDVEVGMKNAKESAPIIRIDGPYYSFAGNYSKYNTLMLVADTSDAGKGLVTSSSILSSLLKYRWRNQLEGPSIVHFYWILKENQIQNYTWFLYTITDLSFEFKKLVESEPNIGVYLEINIYILPEDTSTKPASKTKSSSGRNIDIKKLDPKSRRDRHYHELTGFPIFNVDDLFEMMMKPPETSSDQIEKMKQETPKNRLQELWIWQGQPDWDEIFNEIDTNRVDKTVCVISTCKNSQCEEPLTSSRNEDLKKMVNKYNKDGNDFHLHSCNN